MAKNVPVATEHVPVRPHVRARLEWLSGQVRAIRRTSPCASGTPAGTADIASVPPESRCPASRARL